MFITNHKDQCEIIEAAVLPEIMEETAADLPLSPKVGTPLSTLSFAAKGEVIESSISFDGETPSRSYLSPLNCFLFLGVTKKAHIVEMLNSITTTTHKIM